MWCGYGQACIHIYKNKHNSKNKTIYVIYYEIKLRMILRVYWSNYLCFNSPVHFVIYCEEWHNHFFQIIKKTQGGGEWNWRDGLAPRSNSCSHRELEFGSYTFGWLIGWLTVTLMTPGLGSNTLLWSLWTPVCMHIYSYMDI